MQRQVPRCLRRARSQTYRLQSHKSRWAALEVLWVALRLGLTSFGGPIAHLGYFREEYVVQRRWLDETNYADVVALCQFLPGPASSQVGIAVGYIRSGTAGGRAAWLRPDVHRGLEPRRWPRASLGCRVHSAREHTRAGGSELAPVPTARVGVNWQRFCLRLRVMIHTLTHNHVIIRAI